MRKKTHEEYVAELAEKAPYVEVVSEYAGAKTKILHHCLKHDVYWDTAPTNALQGKGCELCIKEKRRAFNRKTTEQYIFDLKKANPSLEVLDEYIDSHTPILHRCKIHDVLWNIAPTCALQGYGCIKCKSEKIRNKLKRTHKEYVDELKIANPNIVPIEEYVDSNTPILHRCLIDGYVWYARPGNMLSMVCGCPMCSQRFRRNHDTYVDELFKINPDIEVIEEFIDMRTPIAHRCLRHNVIWNAAPDSTLRGHGCRECGNDIAREKLTKTHEQYVEDVRGVNEDIIAVGIYVNSYTPMLHKCARDGYEWLATPASILSGSGCPMCNESKGEREVRQWLISHDIDFKYQKKFDDCADKFPLPFDFYLPKYNCCIEFDGEQHYRPVEYFGGEEVFKKQVEHDRIKDDYCENNDIGILRIPYFKNVSDELNNFLFI